MSIDIKLITQLREQTGAGVGDCKKALEEAGGDLVQAVELMRKKGEIKAANKSDRATKEGVVALKKDGEKISALVLSCETDFAARNEDFVKTADELAGELLSRGEDGFRESAEARIKNELIIKISENIQLGDFAVISGGVLGSYVHFDKKTAGVVALSGGEKALADELAMQVVAMSPKYLNPETVPADVLEKEKEIYSEQLKGEGKPAEMIEKILGGKLSKFYEENCLLNQIYIKDDKKKISDLLKEAGEGVAIVSFRKFQV